MRGCLGGPKGLSPITQADAIDASVVMPLVDGAVDLRAIVDPVIELLSILGVRHEVIVISEDTDDRCSEADPSGVTRITAGKHEGYASRLRRAFERARGRYVITVDPGRGAPEIVAKLWHAREPLGISIASRYVRAGSAKMHPLRSVLSRLLNGMLSRGLSLPVHDVTSAYRIYPAGALEHLGIRGRDLDVLPEILVRAYAKGWRVGEIPFAYAARRDPVSKRRLLRLALAHLTTFLELWRLRNSIHAADYDDRAYDSPIPLQRAWQRRRHDIVASRATSSGRILDIGCGSGRIVRTLAGAVGLDVNEAKLRYMTRYSVHLVQGSAFALPFRSDSFDTVVCSEVLEHIPESDAPFMEMSRVLRPGGRLVLSTPDYARRRWRIIERLYRILAPGGYVDEHITHYTHDKLRQEVSRHGHRHLTTDYVFGSVMVLTFQKL